MPRAYLGLGSNVGNRREHLAFAVRELARYGSILARSPLLETDPIDCPGGERFLNACVCLDTPLAPRELLAAVIGIESARGRRRRFRNEPRMLDIDVLLIDDIVIREPEFTLPHPRMHTREFVLDPLASIAPEVVHPLLRLNVRELRGRLQEVTSETAFPLRSG